MERRVRHAFAEKYYHTILCIESGVEGLVYRVISSEGHLLTYRGDLEFMVCVNDGYSLKERDKGNKWLEELRAGETVAPDCEKCVARFYCFTTTDGEHRAL